jgi:DNA adenine methylase
MLEWQKELLNACNIDPHVEKRDSFKRAPFAWPGGKYRSQEQLAIHLPYRRGYAEHCGGSGVTLINRKKSKLEIFNDRYSGVTCFYRCLQTPENTSKLIDRLSFILNSREEFLWCAETWESCSDTVERAARWFYMIKMSFGSMGRHWGRSTAGDQCLSRKFNETIKEFPFVHSRFKDVQLDNLDVVQSIKDYDTPDMVHYIDPDYLGSHSGHYKHRMPEAKHIEILNTIMQGKGFFAISGYAHPLYDDSQWEWDARYTWKSLLTMDKPTYTDDDKAEIEDRLYASEILWIRDNS